MNAAPSPSVGSPFGLLTSWIRAWDRFWFDRADPTPLGVIRIVCGLLLLYLHLAYTVDLQELFGRYAWVDPEHVNEWRYEWPWLPPVASWADRDPSPGLPSPPTAEEVEYIHRYGIDPRTAPFKGYYAWSIWFHVTDPTAMAVVHGAILVIILLFTIGLGTRVTGVLTWLGVVSYIQRGQTSVFGMDTMMNLVLLYLIIGPSGAALSVDRLLARYRARRQALREHRPLPMTLRPAPQVSANLALRLLQINLCIIYLVSGLTKLQGTAWWTGQAVWGTLSNPEFSPIYWQPFLDLLTFLSHHRLLWEICITSASVFTLITEIGFPFAIWNRSLRWVFLTLAVGLHTGIALFMGLNTFSMMMLCFLLAFVPVETYHKVLDALEQWWSPASREALALPTGLENGKRRIRSEKVPG